MERTDRSASPHYRSVETQLATQRAERPDLAQQLQQPDDALLGRLHEVYVTSDSANAQPPPAHSMPSDSRRLLLDPLPAGPKKPARVPYGRATFDTIVELLERYRDKDKSDAGCSLNQLALEYQLDEQVCADIVANFSVMRLYHIDEIEQTKMKMDADVREKLMFAPIVKPEKTIE